VHVKETADNAKSINGLVPKNVQTTSVTDDKEFKKLLQVTASFLFSFWFINLGFIIGDTEVRVMDHTFV